MFPFTHYASARAFSARFISSNPLFVSRSRLLLNTGTRIPVNCSLCWNRTFPMATVLITKLCSPSNTPGNRRRPSHRSSRPVSATKTVRTEGHTFGSAWLNTHFKPRSLLRGSMDKLDKGIPLRIDRKISKDGPDAVWRCINFYFCI